MSTPKIARNAPCPCGSGLKYKRCCLASGKVPVPPGAAAGPKRKRAVMVIVLGCMAVGIGLGLGAIHGLEVGIAGVLATVLAGSCFMFLYRPPASSGRDEGGASIGFGTQAPKPKKQLNRSQRRSREKREK